MGFQCVIFATRACRSSCERLLFPQRLSFIQHLRAFTSASKRRVQVTEKTPSFKQLWWFPFKPQGRQQELLLRSSHSFSSKPVVKDVLLFEHDRTRFFRILALFCGGQFLFWTYLAYFAFTGLRDTRNSNKEPPRVRSDLGLFSFDMNLGSSAWRFGFTLGCLVIGGGIVGLGVLFSRRSVSRVLLHKGGGKVTVCTQSPLGSSKAWHLTVPLNQWRDYFTCQDLTASGRDWDGGVRFWGEWQPKDLTLVFLSYCETLEKPNMEMYQSTAGAAFSYGPHSESSAQLDLNSTIHLQKKLTEAVTSCPNLNAVTSSPNLHWLLESSVVSEAEAAWETLASFSPSTLTDCPCVSQCSSPDPFHTGTGGRPEHPDRDHISEAKAQEECERRRARRERNRIAAARCRDRRRMLTDTLQNETERLERVKSELEEEIAGLERERERLELVLEAHKPVCKMDGSIPE